MNEKEAKKIIGICIDLINYLSKYAHHKFMSDASDRDFIENYVLSCIPFVEKEPQILEFDGGVVYADKIIKQLGGTVKYATKRGRLDWNNKISYEFDIERESLQNKFDLIIATQFLGSFVDPCMITRKLKNMLKPNGVLLITVSGPAYPRVKGLVSFYSREGLIQIGRDVFGAKNVRNARSYCAAGAAICMLNYLSKDIFSNKQRYMGQYKQEVINGILCINA